MAWFGLENQVYNLAFLRLIRMAVPTNAGREWLPGTILRNSQFFWDPSSSHVEDSFKAAHSSPRGANAHDGDLLRHRSFGAGRDPGSPFARPGNP